MEAVVVRFIVACDVVKRKLLFILHKGVIVVLFSLLLLTGSVYVCPCMPVTVSRCVLVCMSVVVCVRVCVRACECVHISGCVVRVLSVCYICLGACSLYEWVSTQGQDTATACPAICTTTTNHIVRTTEEENKNTPQGCQI